MRPNKRNPYLSAYYKNNDLSQKYCVIQYELEGGYYILEFYSKRGFKIHERIYVDKDLKYVDNVASRWASINIEV